MRSETKDARNHLSRINEETLLRWKKNTPSTVVTWHGRRLFAADGSKINLPRELVKEGYPIHDQERQHYPMGLLSVLYRLSRLF